MSVRIGVVGGTGFVGRALCKAGIKRGLDVVSVSLQGCYPYSGHQFSQFQGALTPFWADSVVWRRVDVCKPTAIPALEKALQGCSAVLHAVGTFKDDRQYPNRTLEDVNIVSVRNTLKAAEHIGASSFVLVSAISSPPLAHQDAVASKRKAESLLESTRGLSTSVLRPGFLYGMERVGSTLLAPCLHLWRRFGGSSLGPFLEGAIHVDVMADCAVSLVEVPTPDVHRLLGPSDIRELHASGRYLS